MATERTVTIPLRREWLKSVKYKRAKKAVRAIREYLMRHWKVADVENVKLGKYLNLELWKHGIKNPPSRVKVNVSKDDKGVVTAELFGAPKEEKKMKAPKKKGETKLTDVKAATAEASKPASADADQPTKSARPEEKKPAASQAPAQPAPAKQPARAGASADQPARKPALPAAPKQQPQIIR